jgi:hypothetical protein
VPSFPLPVWTIIIALIALAVIASLWAAASRLRFENSAHDLRVRTVKMRNDYVDRVARLRRGEEGPVDF